jgi:hypothetical protein
MMETWTNLKAKLLIEASNLGSERFTKIMILMGASFMVFEWMYFYELFVGNLWPLLI